jgi:uncharacterized protein (DUF885 family)
MRGRSGAAVAALTALAIGCAALASARGLHPPSFTDLRDAYFLFAVLADPVTGTQLGADGYRSVLSKVNGQLRDWSPDALAREAEVLRRLQRDLAAVDPHGLGPADRVDRDVVGAQLAYALRRYEARLHEQDVRTYVLEPLFGVNSQIQQMQAFPDGLVGTQREWELVVQRVAAVPRFLSIARANLLDGVRAGRLPDRRVVEREGIDGGLDLAEFLGTDLPVMAAEFIGPRPFAASLLPDLERAGTEAAHAFRTFVGFLKQAYDPADPVDRLPIGEEEYAWRVRNNLRVDLAVAELYAHGAREVALVQGQMFAAAEEVALAAGLDLPFDTDDHRRGSTRAVLVYLGRDAPSSDAELLRRYRDLAADVVAYGRAQGLFALPEDYRLDIVETPPALRSAVLAGYVAPPPYKPGGVGQFYVTPTDDDPAALRASSRAFMSLVTVHEGFPGHDWHFRVLRQNLDKVSNVRWLGISSVGIEGWGHYAETLLADPGPGRPHGFFTPETVIGFLQGALLRAVRVRVDVGLHTGRMTYDESVDYFTAEYAFRPGACAAAGVDPDAAAACAMADREIFRYATDATQAITYNLGKHAILDLRADCQARLGPTYSDSAFYAELLVRAIIPPGFFRDELLDDHCR